MPSASLLVSLDRTNGSILWANNYDGSRRVGRLLDMEADIAGDVATALGQPYGIIFQADVAQAPQGPPDEWEAYACTLAYYSYRMVLDQPTHSSVKQCLERAVQRFPGYATAWALLSLIYLDELRFGYRIHATAPAPLRSGDRCGTPGGGARSDQCAGYAGTNA